MSSVLRIQEKSATNPIREAFQGIESAESYQLVPVSSIVSRFIIPGLSQIREHCLNLA